MTGPRVEMTPQGGPLSFEQFAASQTAPLSALRSADPAKQTTSGVGRPLSFDEFQQAQGMTADQLKSWHIPALPVPTIRRDVTATPADDKVQGKQMEGLAGVLTRQLVNPVLDNPAISSPLLALAVPGAAAAAPVAAVTAGGFMAGMSIGNIARYGWQKAHELVMSPEDRAKSEADPDRMSGEAAAVQAAMLGLAPLIHVGVGRANAAINAATDVGAGMVEAGARGAAAEARATAGLGRQAGATIARDRFAAQLQAGAQSAATPEGVVAPKGFEPTGADVKAGRVKPVEGLIVPEEAKPGRVKPIETEPASAGLQSRADIDAARRDYEAQRVTEDQGDIAAARLADAERVLGLRDEEPVTPQIRRRPGGVKAPYFETPQGAEVLGAMASRHGLAEDANPYHPNSPLAPEWDAGHQSATQSYPIFPEGFTMGGAESRIPADYNPPKVQGFEPTVAPPGATPETAELAAAIRPSRFRGHSTDELVRVAQSARETIDRAQGTIDRGEATTTAEKAVTRANSTLAQVEREAALRGITGDDLAKRIAGEPTASGLTPIEGTGPTRTRGLSAGVQEKAITNKLDLGLGDVPQYQQVSMADQAQRASALIESDPNLARRVALGHAPPPRNLLPESVFVAVENRAIQQGDVATLRELATGKLATEATTMGQRIRTLAERDPDSPVAAIQEVITKRSGGASPDEIARTTNDEVARMREHVAATPIAKGDWTDFINSLKC